MALNFAEQSRWTVIAAENGEPGAQYNAYVDFMNFDSSTNQIRALFWLRKSAAAGDKMARDELTRIGNEASGTQSGPLRLDPAFNLTPAQSQSLAVEALNGSGEAAAQLYSFYRTVFPKPTEARRWLVIGAENGDVEAQYKLYRELIASADKLERLRAGFWLTRAAIGGHTDAQVLARAFDQTVLPPSQDAADRVLTAGGIRGASQVTYQAMATPSTAAVRTKRQLVEFLIGLSSTSEITTESIGRQFGGALMGEDGYFVYRSADLGNGWNYGVKFHAPSRAFKAGFAFWLSNPDKNADPTPICVLSLDGLRKKLVSHGYKETFDHSETGGVDSVEFSKNDISLTVLASNLLVAPNGDECVNAIQTVDGRH